jgi:CheY-like chemotaxis protein
VNFACDKDWDLPDNFHRSRVLIVDDECVIADTLAMILEQKGYHTKAVYSGETAVESAIDLRPDFVISDVVMAGMNGIEAALRIAVILPECRIILVSGNAATADLLQDAHSHGHHFEILAKPLHPQILIDRLKSFDVAAPA